MRQKQASCSADPFPFSAEHVARLYIPMFLAARCGHADEFWLMECGEKWNAIFQDFPVWSFMPFSCSVDCNGYNLHGEMRSYVLKIVEQQFRRSLDLNHHLEKSYSMRNTCFDSYMSLKLLRFGGLSVLATNYLNQYIFTYM